MPVIRALHLRQLTGTLDHGGEFWEERQLRPLDMYAEHREAPEPCWLSTPLGGGRSRIRGVFLELVADDGRTGLAGPFDEHVAYVIDRQLRPFVEGADPLATERIWDQAYRRGVHGRKGVGMMALSAVDVALWDLKGQLLRQPVHRLLGGPTRSEIPAYASALGFCLEPSRVVARARELRTAGYRATKWFFREGPSSGREGLERNLALARLLRETLGPSEDLMFDAWMGWDLPYALRMAEGLGELAPRWLEEPLLPDQIGALAELRRRSPVPIATGEHEYTRWGFAQLLDAQAADVLQPDPCWGGGPTEMLKICALASTRGVPVVFHGHSVQVNVHLAMALSPAVCPQLEFLVKWNVLLQFFWRRPLVPVDGKVYLDEAPGFGTELDPDRIEDERELRWN